MGIMASKLVEQFKNDEFRPVLSELYGDDQVDYQTNRYIETIETFIESFGDDEVSVFSAPGRTEVGGNHTDHQCGKVLAAAVNSDAIAVAAKTRDNRILVKSKGYRRVAKINTWQLRVLECDRGSSQGLIRGIAAYLKSRHFKVYGFKAYVSSEVLSGSGLSSSAAFEILIGTIISGLFNHRRIGAVLLAKAGQFAENKYFGKPCGLMDQMACSLGGLSYIDFQNKSKPVFKNLQIDLESKGYKLCITDTKGTHSGLTDEYAAVPGEMKKIADFFGEDVLRDVKEEEFYKKIAQLREEAGDRAVLRAIHFFEEEKRVEKETEAIEAEDMEAFFENVKASGNSSFKYLQNVYLVNDVQYQPMSVGLAVSEAVLEGRGASRVHGGGFGGTIQAYVPKDLIEKYKESMENIYGEGACRIMSIRNRGGFQIV